MNALELNELADSYEDKDVGRAICQAADILDSRDSLHANLIAHIVLIHIRGYDEDREAKSILNFISAEVDWRKCMVCKAYSTDVLGHAVLITSITDILKRSKNIESRKVAERIFAHIFPEGS